MLSDKQREALTDLAGIECKQEEASKAKYRSQRERFLAEIKARPDDEELKGKLLKHETKGPAECDGPWCETRKMIFDAFKEELK